jgi:hypothetical protein
MSGETRFIHTEASKALRRKRVTLIAPSGAAMCTACASSPPLKRVANGLPKLSADDDLHIEKGPAAWLRSVAKYSAPMLLSHFVGDAGLR